MGSVGSLPTERELPRRKALGQHFLHDPSVIGRIVGAVPEGTRSVLEVGPGPAVLTGPLCERGLAVMAVERDERMRAALEEKAPGARVIFGDALEVDLGALLAEMAEPRVLVSNMPYQITGPLLERFEGVADRVERLVLMMQKEVAVRICAGAGSGERGGLSVRMQARFEIRKVLDAGPGAFSPPPKVTSTVLAFVPRQEARDWAGLAAVTGAGFRHPRKALLNTLGAVYGKPRAQEAIAELGRVGTVRPHELTEEEWWALVARLS